MTKGTKLPTPSSSRLHLKKPLMYLNFSKKQKLAAYDYLINSSKLPRYTPIFDEDDIDILNSYSDSVSDLLDEAQRRTNSKRARNLQEVALIKAYKRMYDSGDAKTFMDVVRTVYGEPSEELFWYILEETIDYAHHQAKDKNILDEVIRLINLRRMDKKPGAYAIHTKTKVFKETQQIFKQSYAKEVAELKKVVATKPKIHRYSQEEIIQLFEALLKFYGLEKHGWKVVANDKTERATVNYENKKISVAPGPFRLSRARAIGWALHEVGVHAVARQHVSRSASVLGERRVIEEGLGTFIEQMVFSRFQPVRSLRYIALGLALGIDGKPRNAKEVYEIIWRLRYLGGVAKNKRFAKEYAAKEVIRIFRGMPLYQKGVVITKDRAYIEGNQLIWGHIEAHGPQFIFEKLLGKRT